MKKIELGEDWHGYALEIFYNHITKEWILSHTGDYVSEEQSFKFPNRKLMVTTFKKIMVGIIKYVEGKS